MDGGTGEVALIEETVEFSGSGDTLDKNDHLVEIQGVKEVVEFTILLVFVEHDVMLDQTMEGELGFIVHVDLHCLY
jgi:hypothetical protein